MSYTPAEVSHGTLRASLKRLDAGYALPSLKTLTLSAAVRNSRIREVLHFGVRLCDAHICSAGEIQKLVNNRIAVIKAETSSFVPNVLEGDEETKDPDTRFNDWVADLGEKGEEDLRSIFTGRMKNAEMKDEKSRHATARADVPSIPPRGLASHEHELSNEAENDDEGWETDSSEASVTHLATASSSQENLEQTHPTTPNRPPSSIHDPLTFSEIHQELRHFQSEYNKNYMTEWNARTLDYYQTRRIITDAIEQAKYPDTGLTPQKLWDEVEEKVHLSANKESARVHAMGEETGEVYVRDMGTQTYKPWKPVSVFEFRKLGNRVTSWYESDSGEEGEVESGDGDEDEDGDEEEHVRRMVAEVSVEDRFGNTDGVLVPTTPTETTSDHKHRVSSGLGVSVSNGLARRFRSKNYALDDTDDESHITHDHTFAPIFHANKPMSAAPPIMRSFYRTAVQQALGGLLDATDNEDMKEMLHQYWEHVEKEVPAVVVGSGRKGIAARGWT